MRSSWIFVAFATLLAACSAHQESPRPYLVVAGNPLFNEFNKPIDFKSVTADHIRQAADTVISYARAELQRLYAIDDDDRTFDNTMLYLDDIGNDVDRIASTIYLLGSTHPDSLVRTTAQQKSTELEKFGNEISLSDDLYNAVKAYSQSAEARTLTGYKERYLRERVEAFERNGFALPKELRDSLRSIMDDISEIGTAFNRHIAAYQDELILREADMEGLPEDYKQARRQPDGTYRIDLSYPSYLPFMKYSKSDRARKALYIKYYNRAADTNIDLLRRLLQKRQQFARLLGYKTYAEWRLEDRMVLTPENVWEFEENLIKSVRPKAEADYQELLAVRRARMPKGPDKINHWESAYLENILLEEKYQVDDNVIKEYFPLDNVLAGLFQITQSLFNVRYVEIENPSVWHPDVRAFEVFDGDKL